MSELSILHRVTRADIRHEPFAHIVLKGCLPAQIYAGLEQSFPADQTILRLEKFATGGPPKPNSRHDVGAQCILGNPESFAEGWRQFAEYHVSNAFFREFIELMGPEILAAYPELELRFGRPLRDLRTGVLDTPEADDCDIALDCHIGINTPARRRGSVRRVHTDAPDELFAALIYFRAEDDRAEGGNLEIFRWKRNRIPVFVGSEVDESDAELSHTVVTAPNSAVVFVNTPYALHAVSARSPSFVSRRLVNIMGRIPRSIPDGLFVKRQKSDLWSLGRRALQRYKIVTGRF